MSRLETDSKSTIRKDVRVQVSSPANPPYQTLKIPCFRHKLFHAHPPRAADRPPSDAYRTGRRAHGLQSKHLRPRRRPYSWGLYRRGDSGAGNLPGVPGSGHPLQPGPVRA